MNSLTAPQMGATTEYRPNGALLLELRLKAGLSIRLAAALSNLDIRTIVGYEADEATAKFQYNQLRALADLYKVSTDSLVVPARRASAPA